VAALEDIEKLMEILQACDDQHGATCVCFRRIRDVLYSIETRSRAHAAHQATEALYAALPASSAMSVAPLVVRAIMVEREVG